MMMIMMNYNYLLLNAAPRLHNLTQQNWLYVLHSCAAGFRLQLRNLGLQCSLLLLKLFILHMRTWHVSLRPWLHRQMATAMPVAGRRARHQ